MAKKKKAWRTLDFQRMSMAGIEKALNALAKDGYEPCEMNLERGGIFRLEEDGQEEEEAESPAVGGILGFLASAGAAAAAAEAKPSDEGIIPKTPRTPHFLHEMGHLAHRCEGIDKAEALSTVQKAEVDRILAVVFKGCGPNEVMAAIDDVKSLTEKHAADCNDTGDCSSYSLLKFSEKVLTKHLEENPAS